MALFSHRLSLFSLFVYLPLSLSIRLIDEFPKLQLTSSPVVAAINLIRIFVFPNVYQWGLRNSTRLSRCGMPVCH